jgi:hypothetical protein
VRDDTGADGLRFDFAELEDEGSRDVLPLERRLAPVELPRLVVMIGEVLGPRADLRSAQVLAIRDEAVRRLPRPAADEPRVRRVVDAPGRVERCHVTVLLKVPKRALRSVDRQLREVRAAEPHDLRIEIREVASLQERVVAELDARDDVLGPECDLLGLGEGVLDVTIENEPPHASDRNQLFGYQLRRVERIER